MQLAPPVPAARACSMSAIATLMLLVAHTNTAWAACPFSASLGATGGYSKDLSMLNMTNTTQAAPQYSRPSNCTPAEYTAIVANIVGLLEKRAKDPTAGGLEAPRTVRAAFHSAATYRANAGPNSVGGSNGGWIQFKNEVEFPENAGIEEPVDTLLELRQNHTCITFADLVMLAGAVAQEWSGGPAIAWMPGRRDALKPLPGVAVSASLPDGTFGGSAIMYWLTNMGLSARDGVAFIGGGHSAGAANFENSGWNGSFSPDLDRWPEVNKNRYFTHLINLDWEPSPVTLSGRQQFMPKPAPGLMGENGGPIIR